MPALTHSPADITAKLLVDFGLGADPGSGERWETFEGSEPDVPDDCITVYVAAGLPHGRQMHGEAVESQGIQLRVRSRNQGQGWEKAHAIRTALAESVYGAEVSMAADGDDGLPAAAYRVHCYSDIGSVLPLGRDGASARFLHTLNVMMTVRQTN